MIQVYIRTRLILKFLSLILFLKPYWLISKAFDKKAFPFFNEISHNDKSQPLPNWLSYDDKSHE